MKSFTVKAVVVDRHGVQSKAEACIESSNCLSAGNALKRMFLGMGAQSVTITSSVEKGKRKDR